MEHETEPAEADRPAMGSADAQDQPAPARPEQEARPATGEPRVDAALKLLDRLPGMAVGDHPDLFEQVHAQLTDVLGELDSGSADAASEHGD